MIFSAQTGNCNFKEGSILLVDKPLKWTSFDVVNKIRYALKPVYKKIKVGHAGTLDPLASGLLVICTGKMTKQINDLTNTDKTYSGTFFLGASTPSFDLETEVIAQADIKHIQEKLLQETAQKFTGKINQVPPIYSAIKKDGQKAYHAARKGEHIELKAREVIIHQFDITKVAMPLVYFQVACSKGTYIRSLANDFGIALNSLAYLHTLRREKVGEYDVKNAWQIEDLVDAIKQNSIAD